jgi:deoxyadenosine/deoxycytidine kinase
MLEHVEAPKLMIYLQIDTDSAIERIKKRGRDYEQIVEREYWERLNNEYESYFKDYNLSPVLIIDAAKYDIVENSKDKEEVLNIIHQKLKDIDNFNRGLK